MPANILAPLALAAGAIYLLTKGKKDEGGPGEGLPAPFDPGDGAVGPGASVPTITGLEISYSVVSYEGGQSTKPSSVSGLNVGYGVRLRKDQPPDAPTEPVKIAQHVSGLNVGYAVAARMGPGEAVTTEPIPMVTGFNVGYKIRIRKEPTQAPPGTTPATTPIVAGLNVGYAVRNRKELPPAASHAVTPVVAGFNVGYEVRTRKEPTQVPSQVLVGASKASDFNLGYQVWFKK